MASTQSSHRARVLRILREYCTPLCEPAAAGARAAADVVCPRRARVLLLPASYCNLRRSTAASRLTPAAAGGRRTPRPHPPRPPALLTEQTHSVPHCAEVLRAVKSALSLDHSKVWRCGLWRVSVYVWARRALNALNSLTGGLRCGQNGSAAILRAAKESDLDATAMLKGSALSGTAALSSDEGNEARRTEPLQTRLRRNHRSQAFQL